MQTQNEQAQQQFEHPDTGTRIWGGVGALIGCAFIYTGLGVWGLLTKWNLDFGNWFAGFEKSDNVFWQNLGGGTVSVGVIVTFMGILLALPPGGRK